MSDLPWALGRTTPKKRIHRADCKYARIEYRWAGERTEHELLAALCESGAYAWHDAGVCCCPELDVSLHRARILAGVDSE